MTLLLRRKTEINTIWSVKYTSIYFSLFRGILFSSLLIALIKFCIHVYNQLLEMSPEDPNSFFSATTIRSQNWVSKVIFVVYGVFLHVHVENRKIMMIEWWLERNFWRVKMKSYNKWTTLEIRPVSKARN